MPVVSASDWAYQIVADWMRQQIEDGTLKPGGSLPSVKDLQEKFGTGEKSVQQAITELVGEGLLETMRGRASRVRIYDRLPWDLSSSERAGRKPAQTGDDPWDAYVREMGHLPRQVFTGAQPIQAPADIADLLNVPVGSTVWRRSRNHHIDGVPVEIVDSYFSAKLAEEIPALTEPADQRIPGGILAAAGHPQDFATDRIIGRMPGKDEKFRLQIPEGTPVLQITRTGYEVSYWHLLRDETFAAQLEADGILGAPDDSGHRPVLVESRAKLGEALRKAGKKAKADPELLPVRVMRTVVRADKREIVATSDVTGKGS